MQILFDNEPLPDHMTMKQLWLSRWFGKVCIHHQGWQPLILGFTQLEGWWGDPLGVVWGSVGLED